MSSESGPKIIPSVPDDFDFAKDKEEITFGHVELDPKDFSKLGSEITQQQANELSPEEREKLEYREKNNSWLKVSDRRVGPEALEDAEWDLAVKGYSAGYENLVDKEAKEKKPEVVEAVKKYDEVVVAKDHGTKEEYEKAKEEFQTAKEELIKVEEKKEKTEAKPAFEPPPTLHHLDEHPEEMSLEYIQRQVEKAKYQGGLSKYYWEDKLKNAKAAEKESTQKPAVDEARQQAVENLKTDKKESWGERFKNSVKSHYEVGKEKAKSKWPFWKERLKGAATAGGLEYYHAEKFRRATRDVGADTATQAYLVNVEDYVTFEEINKKAMEKGQIKEGEIWRDVDKKQLENFSNEILGEKILVNQEIENRLVTDAKVNLSQRLAKYISTGGIKGKEFLEQKWPEVEVRLRQSIGDIRKNRILDEMTDYVKLYRQSFDVGASRWNKWKMRYVYGAVETALWLTGAALIWSKLSGAGAGIPGPSGSEFVPQGPQMPSVPSGLDPMDQNVWNTIDNLAKQDYGIDLTNQQLVDLSQQAVQNQNNHIGVNVWDIPGSPLDTNLPQGHLLDLSTIRETLSGMVSR